MIAYEAIKAELYRDNKIPRATVLPILMRAIMTGIMREKSTALRGIS